MLLHLEICQQSRPWECGNPEGISKECGKGGKPAPWLSTLSILCHFHGRLWKRVSQSHNHREGPFWEQEPLVRDGDLNEIASRRTHLLTAAASGSTGNTEKCCWPSRAVAPLRSADIAIAVPAADLRLPSLTTRVETGMFALHCQTTIVRSTDERPTDLLAGR